MTQRYRIMLLNPPGDKIYVRDYYCSKVSKARYLYHPVDLLILSGTLDSEHDIRVVDAMTDGWTKQRVIDSVTSFRPDIIVFLTGVVSFKSDFRFIETLRTHHDFASIASGELFLDEPDRRLAAFPEIDGAILDFTSPNILTLVNRLEPDKHFAPGPPIPQIVYRTATGDVISGGAHRSRNGEFEIPLPRHDLFPNHKYRYPFVRRFPFATVLTDFGCPFNCRFCAIGTLGYKVRSIDNVLEELDFIKTLGFKDIYFDDQTFGANRPRTETLLKAMIQNRYKMGFICFTRADTVDEAFLQLMREAGCHTVVFGVESPSDDALKNTGKGLTVNHIRTAVNTCRKLHIRTVGTFIVGLPGMTRREAERIADFAIDLKLDFASFNVPTPRPGTALRDLAIRKGWITPELGEMDQSGSFTVMGNEYLSPEDVLILRNRASRRFYLRPLYLLNRLMGIRTLYELRSHLKEMVNLVHPKRFEKHH